MPAKQQPAAAAAPKPCDPGGRAGTVPLPENENLALHGVERFLSAHDADRALRVFRKLTRHDTGGWALTGGFASRCIAYASAGGPAYDQSLVLSSTNRCGG
jgi:hypothetical protein